MIDCFSSRAYGVWLAALILFGQTGPFGVTARAQVEAPSASSRYVQDVEFLLTELEKRAGHFFAVKRVDWAVVGRQFRREVAAVTNDAAHVQLCSRLLARLQDGHAHLRDLKVQPPDESNGRRWTGPRVHLLVIGEKVYVRTAFGEAKQRGLVSGTEVIAIDGVPAQRWLEERMSKRRETTGYSTDHQALYAVCHWGLADWAGTKIEFEVQDGDERRKVSLLRQGGSNFVPLGPIFPPTPLQTTGRQSYGRSAGGFGYIHLRDVPGGLPAQLDTMLEAIGDVPGLILDLRANGGGGCDHQAVFARFVGAGTTWRQIQSAGKKPFAGPMVAIVDAGTRSAGETVASMLKEDGRVYVIGDGPTAGTSSQKTTLAVPSGLFTAYFSVASNMRRSNQGRGLEGLGVQPHETVPYDPAELRRNVDTQIRRAEELLRQGLPSVRSSAGIAR